MTSIEEVYKNLKKQDSKNQLTISDDNETLVLTMSDDEKLIAWDDYVSAESKGVSITHWHPDYDEMYMDFLKIMKNIEPFPIKKEIRKTQFKAGIIGIASTIPATIFCVILNIENDFLIFIVIIVFIILFYLVIGRVKRIKKVFYKDYIPTSNGEYPLECEEPYREENEVERIYNSDKRRIISIYKKNKVYTYDIIVKGYDDYSNSFYWSPANTRGVSFYDTKEKAIEEALVLYPVNEKISIKQENVIAAHQFCSNNKPALLKDNSCGCFYCLEIFTPDKIKEWIQDTKGTALCPFCGIDSVIGKSSGYSITKEFLEKMHQYWFEK